MAWKRRKPSPDGKRVYVYRVESYRDRRGRVRQRQTYVGREMVDEAGKPRVRRGHSRDPNVEEVLPFGDVALLWDTASSLELVSTIDRLAPAPGDVSVGKALVTLAINHLTGRRALADIASWYEWSMLRYWVGVGPDLLSEKRLLTILDAVCHQDEDVLRDKTWLISDALRRRVEAQYGKGNPFVYYDRTQIVYVGQECEWGEFGYGHDAHPDRRKIGMGVVVRRADGFPVMYRTYRGSQHDVTTVETIADRLGRSDLKGLIVVIDRGMASHKTVQSLMDQGFRVVSGVPASHNAYHETVARFDDDAVERVENRIRRQGRTLFAVEHVTADRGKYVLYQDPRLRGELKQGFLVRIGEAEESLRELGKELEDGVTPPGRTRAFSTRVREALGGVADYFTWRKHGDQLTWRLKDDDVQTHLRRLGRVVLHSTDPHVPKADLVHAYLDKDEVEKVWRLGKGGLGLVGVKHYKRDRVVAYLFVCYLAYLLYALVRHRLRAAKFDLSVDKALDHLHRVMVVRLARGRDEFLQTPRPVAIEGELCKKLDLLKWKTMGV